MVNSDMMIKAAHLVRETEIALSALLGVNTVLHLEVNGKEKVTSSAFIGGIVTDLQEQARMKFLFEKKLSPDVIIMAVCEQRCIKMEEVLGSSRRNDHVLARNLCFFFIYHLQSISLAAVAAIFEKGHSTVIHALKSLERDLAQNRRLKRDFDALTKKFKKLSNEDITETN